MIRFFKYLFYRIYTWDLKNWGRNNQPQFNAMFGVSFFMFLNIYSVLQMALNVFGTFLLGANNCGSKLLVAAIMILIFSINYVVFVKGGKYTEITLEFQNEIQKERRKGTIKVGLYIFLSFVIPITIAILYHELGGNVSNGT